MEQRILIGARPRYFRGQLLLEDDFAAEQNYHADARYRHTRNLHGWGVVRGLEVTAAGDTSVRVGPGLAVDGNGREIELHDAAVLDLSSRQTAVALSISLLCEDAPPADGGERRSSDVVAVLRASTELDDAAVLLATVTLDAQGKAGPGAISLAQRRLLPGLFQRGWLRTAFRPLALLPDPGQKPDAVPPAFLVGATRAQALEKGAAGTMLLPLPPEAFRVHRLRVVGEENAGGLDVILWIGGWNDVERKHVKRKAVSRRIEPANPFDATFEVAPPDADLDEESSTMALEVRSAGSCYISLVAVELSCRGLRLG